MRDVVVGSSPTGVIRPKELLNIPVEQLLSMWRFEKLDDLEINIDTNTLKLGD